MGNLWYKCVRTYAHIGLIFYFKKIRTVGKENIPENQPILFVANHRNGLIDPILIATTNNRIFHFLTRASAFKNPIANFLLRSIHMLPIYRIRDGVDTLSKNQEIFEACYTIFEKKESVLIFPEGNHGYPRRVRPLSKGFTRIAFGYLEKNKDKELIIIPVGLNYQDITKPFREVSIQYGKGILANEFYSLPNENERIDALKNKVSEELKKLTTHVENLEKHDVIVKQLKHEKFDFQNPNETNKRIAEIGNWDDSQWEFPSGEIKKIHKNIFQIFISWLFILNTILPILIWQQSKKKVKDIVMLSTFRFGLSVGLIPLFYFLQAGIVSYFSETIYGFFYLIFSFTVAYFRKFIS